VLGVYLTMRDRSQTPWWVVEGCSLRGDCEAEVGVVTVDYLKVY